jgi:hypothetical protein
MKRIVVSLAIVLIAAPAYATPFTWTIGGVAAAGHHTHGFDDFGPWRFNDITANVHLSGFIEQFTTTLDDRLSLRGGNAGATFQLPLLKGTLGNPDFLSLWGPLLALGSRRGLTFDHPGILNSPFHPFDADTGSVTAQTNAVPEPGTLALVGLGIAVAAARKRARRRTVA